MDLYALPPEQFTAARDAAAKQDKTLKALRKPTVSAWVVNTLVRRDPRLLDELLVLGASLAEAQRAGQGDLLRQLGEQRHQLVQAVTSRALELAERDVTAAVRSEVESILEAVLADPASADAVRTGQLVRGLSFVGFGGVDLEGAVAAIPRPHVAPVPRPKKAPAARKPDFFAAEAAALDAAGGLDDAVRRAEAAARAVEEREQALVAANAEQDTAANRVREAQETLKAAEKEQVAARRRRTAAQKEREALVRKARAATKAVAAARDAAEAARAALDRLRRSP